MNVSSPGFKCIKVVALSVHDPVRAGKFYGDTLGLPPAEENGEPVGFLLGKCVLMLKADYAAPTALPNPRITLEVDYAPDTEAFLRQRDVTLSDPVDVYEGRYFVGAFLDSEGNKLWFCSEMKKP